MERTIRDRMRTIRRIMGYADLVNRQDKFELDEIHDWMRTLWENPPTIYGTELKGTRINNAFIFQCSEIKDPIDCGVHMLKPCIQKYFKDHNYTESTSKVEKQMAIIALCHRIEEGLIDYLDELEEFNS